MLSTVVLQLGLGVHDLLELRRHLVQVRVRRALEVGDLAPVRLDVLGRDVLGNVKEVAGAARPLDLRRPAPAALKNGAGRRAGLVAQDKQPRRGGPAGGQAAAHAAQVSPLAF